MENTVSEAVRELLEQTIVAMDALIEASDGEPPRLSSHTCACSSVGSKASRWS